MKKFKLNGHVYTTLKHNQMCVNHNYQQSLRKARARKIAEDFKWHAFGVLVVHLMPDGSYEISDGQHRWVAVGMKFSQTLKQIDIPVIIVDPDAAEPYQTFLDNNEIKGRPTPRSKVWAARNNPKSNEAFILKTLEKHNIKVQWKGTNAGIWHTTAPHCFIPILEHVGRQRFNGWVRVFAESFLVSNRPEDRAMKADFIMGMYHFTLINHRKVSEVRLGLKNSVETADTIYQAAKVKAGCRFDLYKLIAQGIESAIQWS